LVVLAGAVLLAGERLFFWIDTEPPEYPPLQRPPQPIKFLMFRGNPERNLSGIGTVPRRPKLLWRFETKTKIEGPHEQRASVSSPNLNADTPWRGLGWTGQPVRMGDYVYFGSTDSYVYCLEIATGRELWHYENHHCIKGSITMHDGRIFHGGRDNKIHCYTMGGEMVWERKTGQDMDSNPCFVAGRGYIGGEDKHLYCFDPETSEILWKYGPTNGSVESSPCVAGARVYVGSSNGTLYCCDADTGDLIWRHATLGDTDPTPVHKDGRIYVGSETMQAVERGHFWCLDAVTGDVIWHNQTRRGIWATAAVSDDGARVYIGTNGGKLYCYDALTGDTIWRRSLVFRIWSSPVVVDGCILQGVRDGTMWCLREEDGRPLWVFDDGFDIDATPCVSGGLIVIGSQNGWVYCIGEAAPKEEINHHWFRVPPSFSGRVDQYPGGIPTHHSSAAPPRTWKDTRAGT
jgi:outer membrane protein assembly factor BamB